MLLLALVTVLMLYWAVRIVTFPTATLFERSLPARAARRGSTACAYYRSVKYEYAYYSIVRTKLTPGCSSLRSGVFQAGAAGYGASRSDLPQPTGGPTRYGRNESYHQYWCMKHRKRQVAFGFALHV
jgi:hypothetical protein